MAKKAKVWDGSAWQDLASATTDLTPYSTTAQMNTAIGTSAGLNLISSSTFSAAASVTFDNVFSSTYDNYFYTINFTAISASDVEIRWYGRSGSPAADTTSGYVTQVLAVYGSSVNAGYSGTNNRLADGTTGTPTRTVNQGTIYAPYLAQATAIISNGFGFDSVSNGLLRSYSTQQTGTTQFTGIKFYPSGGTISGTIRVYGYKNS